jgi:hypothetical protein
MGAHMKYIGVPAITLITYSVTSPSWLPSREHSLFFSELLLFRRGDASVGVHSGWDELVIVPGPVDRSVRPNFPTCLPPRPVFALSCITKQETTLCRASIIFAKIEFNLVVT